MQIYPAGETITRLLLDLPQQRVEWIITGAEVEDIIAAGFRRQQADETCFLHPESGDIYQLARQQYVDEESGELRYQCDHAVTLENELATRALTILAMASDGDDIIDPFGGQGDLIGGVLRHVTPHFVHVPQNLLTLALWAARLAGWGFSTAHETFQLMKNMVASGVVEQIPQHAISDTVVQVMASPQPSEYFRVLHRCGALRVISHELDVLFEQCNSDSSNNQRHTRISLPDVMRSLDQLTAETGNISSVMKKFHAALGDEADKVFISFGLDVLFQARKNNKD
jgi:tRNA nucleotidyltransferase (CCA-adding enzyme)